MNTEILTQVQSIHVINATIIGMWTTIWTTYICAVIDGTVLPPFSTGTFRWPMISDTWDAFPGNFISRFMMPPFILMWALFCWATSDWLDNVTWNQRYMLRLQNKAMRYLIQIGCFGFLACIAINEDECDPIHSAGALTFFVTQGMFCSNIVFQMMLHPHAVSSPWSLLFKFMVNLFYIILLGTFAVLSRNWHENFVEIAVCEWLAVMMVTLFHWSLRWELKDQVSFCICKKSLYLTM